MRRIATWVAAALFGVSGACAEVCTTQSQMKDADRDSLAAMARTLTQQVIANNLAGLRAKTAEDLAKDFGAVTFLVANTAPRLAGATPVVDQVYLLDATQIKPAPNGTETEAQFFCSLNRSVAEADFIIPGLKPGIYGFAVVRVEHGTTSWRISYLLERDGTTWRMAGIYPVAATSSGHDGLWYWKDARRRAAEKQPWNAWLEYGEAESLLRPASFVNSTHLEKLHTEQTAAAPAAVSEGVSTDVPLVIKSADGAEFHVTSMRLDDAAGGDRPDVAVHLRVEPLADVAAARKRNEDAMHAVLAAYPELRQAFHGVAVVAEAPGATPFTSEAQMADIR